LTSKQAIDEKSETGIRTKTLVFPTENNVKPAMGFRAVDFSQQRELLYAEREMK